MKLTILAANGQISRIVEKRILTEPHFGDVELTLGLRSPKRLASLSSNNRVQLLNVDLTDSHSVEEAVSGQNMVFVATVDHSSNNVITRNVIQAMKAKNVHRVIFTNILGIYNEVPGEFGRWNLEQVKNGLQSAINSDQLLADSGLNYTTLRLPWLNNRPEVNYTVTTKSQPYRGVSCSRQSVADLVLRIVANCQGQFKNVGFRQKEM